MKEFITSISFLWIILPILSAFGIACYSRYAGREFENCKNWKERLGVWFCILCATFVNYFIILLLMILVYLTYKK